MTVADAVRRVRKRLGKNQTEFANMLRCQRNTVSRYELGSFSPGPVVLMSLLQLAESAGLTAKPEADVIMRELRAQHLLRLFGGSGTVEETIASMRPFLGVVRTADAILDVLPEEKRQDVGFRQFVPAVAQIIEACDTVDQSVTDILNMWKAHCSNEAAPQRFRDALGFLRAQLWKKDSAAEARQATGAAKLSGKKD
jgi:transcriptional regulator with XRE-family HTH domain